MNISLFAMAVLVAIVLVGGVQLFYGWLFRFSNRTASDVLGFLIKIDMEIIYGTFLPEAEKHFRETLSAAEFKAIQVKRFHLAIHYSNQLSNNAQVLLSWTRYERKQDWIATSSVAVQRNVQDLRVACVPVPVCCFHHSRLSPLVAHPYGAPAVYCTAEFRPALGRGKLGHDYALRENPATSRAF